MSNNTTFIESLQKDLAADRAEINEIKELRSSITKQQKQNEAEQKNFEKEINQLKRKNIKKLAQLEIQQDKRVEAAQLEAEGRVYNAKIANQELLAELAISQTTRIEQAQTNAENRVLETKIANSQKLAELNVSEATRTAQILEEIYSEQLDEQIKQQKTADSARVKAMQKMGLDPTKESDKNSVLGKLATKASKNEANGVKDSFSQRMTDLVSSIKSSYAEGKENAAENGQSEAVGVLKGMTNILEKGLSKLADFYDAIASTVDEIAKNQTSTNARLQGSEHNWDTVSDAVASTMLDSSVRSEDVANNIQTAIQKGIARDVESMGAIETIKDRVAPTFDTFNSTVLRLIKIQNQNTSYARMGMESSLNTLFNQLYETTEYLSDLASSVRSNLEEAEALMEGTTAVDFEYQVQKWLGSLSSAGMSSSGVSAISDAIGKLAAGQIEGITEGGAGNLLIMAANNANLSISDILADGLDASETNTLLNAMVSYMQDLVSEANGNLVVQQQLAKVFGLTASDLKTAVNLVTEYNTQGTLAGLNNSYSNFLYQAQTGGAEVSLTERMANLFSNVKYSTATEIANSPTLYFTTKVSEVLDSLVGGIEIPSFTVAGTGVDTGLTVTDIIKSASLVTGLVKSLSAAFSSGNALNAAQALAIKSAGSSVKISSGSTTSMSGQSTVYNGSVEDFQSSSEASNNDTVKSRTVKATEESSEVSNSTINENIVNIYTIMKNFAEGSELLHVKLSDVRNAAEAMKVEVVNFDQFSTSTSSTSYASTYDTTLTADNTITNTAFGGSSGTALGNQYATITSV